MTEREFVSSDGVRLVYDETGPVDGPAVVLCHGLAAAAAQFAGDAEFFAGLGHRVLVPDLRGHGRSASPSPMRPEAFSLARLAADLTGMLDHAGIAKVHWVGNSLGGIAALEMLKQQRFRTLTTFGTVYAVSLPQVGGHHLLTASRAVLGQNLLASLAARSTSRDPAAQVLIEAILRRTRHDVNAMLAGVLTRYDLIAAAQAATLPILLLRGGRDAAVNAGLGSTLKAMRGRPNFTLVELPEGGHCANLDARDAFRTAVLRFWQANGA